MANAGNTGVTLFFVLSGYLLGGPFIHGLKRRQLPSIKRFYLNRMLRILPMYFLAVFAAWLTTHNTDAALKALAFIPVGFAMHPYSLPWWSLSTEVQFYLVLPAIAAAILSKHWRYPAIFVLVVWLGFQIAEVIAQQALDQQAWSRAGHTLLRRGSAFAIGMMAAWLSQHERFKAIAAHQRNAWCLLLASLALTAVLLSWYGEAGQKAAYVRLPGYHHVEALLWAGVLLALPHADGWPRQLLHNAFLEHTGKISYSLYLIHIPIQFYWIFPMVSTKRSLEVLYRPDIWLAIAGSATVAWLAAWACYRFIEMPALNLKYRFNKHP